MLPSTIYFGNLFDDFNTPKKLDQLMKCDIYEEGDTYILEMDVPTYKKDEIKIEVENGHLKVTIEKKQDETEEKKYLRHERHSFTKCEREFYVGDINEEEIKASLKDAVLKIIVPKEKEEENTRKTIMIED